MLLTDITVEASLKRAGFKRVESRGDNVAEILPSRKTVGVLVQVDVVDKMFSAVLLNEWDEDYETYLCSDVQEDTIDSEDWAKIIKWIKVRSKK